MQITKTYYAIVTLTADNTFIISRIVILCEIMEAIIFANENKAGLTMVEFLKTHQIFTTTKFSVRSTIFQVQKIRPNCKKSLKLQFKLYYPAFVTSSS